MTDEELIELVESKTPEELTPAEIASIRDALADSPALQQALAGRLEMEQYLAHTLGGIDVTFDQIMLRARQMHDQKPKGLLSALGWLTCGLLAAFVMLILVVAMFNRPAVNGINEVAEADPDAQGTPRGKTPDGVVPHPSAAEELARQQAASQNSKGNAAGVGLESKVAVAEPWEPEIPWDQQAEPDPETLFDDFDTKTAAPLDVDLRKWFTDVAGGRQSIAVRESQGVRCGLINGLFKLRAPWIPTTSLRFALAEPPNLRIHFWNGHQGVTLQYFERLSRSWVGYVTKRSGDEPRPKQLYYTATDEDRYWRTNPVMPALHELRYENGYLTLSRGNVRIIELPLAGPPTETYFDGQAMFRHLSLAKAAPLPERYSPPTKNLLDTTKLAELKWIENLPKGAQFNKHADGRVELTVERPTGAASSAAVPLPGGLFEVIVQLDQPSPGTTVYLGDSAGKVVAPLAFFSDPFSGQVSVARTYPGDPRAEIKLDSVQSPAFYVTSSPWLRIVYGGASTKCWLSADGVHWGRLAAPLPDRFDGQMTLGINAPTVQSTAANRRITMRRLILRELSALNSLAPAALAEQVPRLPNSDLGPWLEAVFESKPVGVDAALWRRACAVRSLGRGINPPMAAFLLDNLVEDGLRERDDAQWQMQLVDEGALLLATLDDGALATRWSQKYERVGQLAYEQGETRPYSLIAHRQMTSPLWTRLVYNFVPESLIRTELIELAYTNRWQDLSDVCNRLDLWRRQAYARVPSIHEWGAAIAMRGQSGAPELRITDSAVEPPNGKKAPRNRRSKTLLLQSDWRHPLVTELSKEGFNVLAEFEAALDGKSYKDACQIISSTAGAGMLGLLPNAQDQQLLMSLSGAVALAMRDHPQLATTMRDEFGPLGLLRIRQAIRDGDVPALEAGTLQFYSTQAAAEAHAWLADRALSGGAFAHALGHYRQARHSADIEMAPRLAAGEQLAAAMLGRTSDEPVKSPVELGKTRLTPADLMGLVSDLRTQHSSEALGSRQTAAASETQVAPKPGRFEATIRGPFDGDQGLNAQNVPSVLNDLDVDWVARQLSAVVVGDRMIVSNRFQVSSYLLKDRRWEWRTGLGGEQAGTHDMSLAPMRPLVTPTRIFVRRMTRLGPALAALDSATGKLQWTTKSEPDKYVVSDPLLVQDELFALVMMRSDQEYSLALCAYDPQAGTLLGERRLVQFRDGWLQQRTCQALADEDRFIIVCGGSVLCFDLAGQPRWVRRQTLVPTQIDRTSARQAHDLPLLAGQRLYVTQPGVREIECLDSETGRLHWRRPLAEGQRLLAILGERLIARTDEGLVALSAADGAVLWRYAERNLLEGCLVGGPGGILVARSEPAQEEERMRPTLVWLDPATGRETATCPLDLRQKKTRIGPFLVHEDHLWTFARSAAGEQRDVVELAPSEQPLAKAGTPPDRWTSQTARILQDAVDLVLPGWTLLDARYSKNTGLESEWQGQRDVLVLVGRPTAVLARTLKLPAGNPKLKLLVSHHPGGRWRLEVRVNGDELLKQAIDKKFTDQNWKPIEVDLSPYAGREVNLVLRSTEDGNAPVSKWKLAEVE